MQNYSREADGHRELWLYLTSPRCQCKPCESEQDVLEEEHIKKQLVTVSMDGLQ